VLPVAGFQLTSAINPKRSKTFNFSKNKFWPQFSVSSVNALMTFKEKYTSTRGPRK